VIWRASEWTASEVASAVGGRLIGADVRLAGVSTDSREAHEAALFVALTGPRFDGHAYAAVARDHGARAILGRADALSVAGVSVIDVADPLVALGALGRAARRRASARVVGLTGSNGKTSTKELLAALLASHGPVLKTEGNLNNAIGVPLTLLGLTPEHAFAVVEMGMNAEGEIAQLVRLAEPDVGMVLNIGPAHIGELGSLEAIARAKGEMFRAVAPGAVKVANADDRRVMEQLGVRRPRVTFGRATDADVRLVSRTVLGEAGGQRLVFTIGEEEHEIRLSWPGEHHASNLGGALACAVALGLQLPGRLDLDVGAVAGRGVRHRFGPWTVIDDAYNANRGSAEAALRSLVEDARGPTALLFGAMAELGEHGPSEHRAVGRLAAQLGVDVVGTYGVGAEALAEAARDGGLGSAHHEPEDVDALWSWFRGRLDSRPWSILLKGSRSAAMERFLKRFGDT
jgi:UDP-N-acetylmuramoyl-tripeptide--D-alanyl-D-alanine ligase